MSVSDQEEVRNDRGLNRRQLLIIVRHRRDVHLSLVVNEALMCGVPVVCSDNCGVAGLLREPWRITSWRL